MHDAWEFNRKCRFPSQIEDLKTQRKKLSPLDRDEDLVLGPSQRWQWFNQIIKEDRNCHYSIIQRRKVLGKSQIVQTVS